MSDVIASKKIRISPETRAMLKARGRKGESYDDVIRRLLEEAEKR